MDSGGESDSYHMLVDPLGDNDEDVLFDDDRVTVKQYGDDGDSSSDNDHYGNQGGGWLDYSEGDDDEDDDDIEGLNPITDEDDDILFGSDRHKRTTKAKATTMNKKSKRKKNKDEDETNDDDNSSSNDNGIDNDEDMDDDDDTMTRAGLSRLRRNFGLPMLDLFGGMMTGLAGQFRNILENLSNHNDQTQQLIALQELAETLSISTEEDLAGFFHCDSFVRELVKIMKGTALDTSSHAAGAGADEDMMLAFALNEQYGGGNPELMLLACRCISNLLDVLPSSASSVVAHGAVGILCDKLKSIEYIDLAEQALGVRTK